MNGTKLKVLSMVSNSADKAVERTMTTVWEPTLNALVMCIDGKIVDFAPGPIGKSLLVGFSWPIPKKRQKIVAKFLADHGLES